MPAPHPRRRRGAAALLAVATTGALLAGCSGPAAVDVAPVAAVAVRHDAPRDLALRVDGDGLTATWAAPPSADALEVTGYEVFVDDAAPVVLDAGATAHRLDGVAVGDGVLVQVRALGADGPGRTAEASTERVYARPAAAPRAADDEQALVEEATATAAATAGAAAVATAAPVPTATSTPTPTVTVTTEPTPAPTMTRDVVQEVSAAPDWVALYREVGDSVVQVVSTGCHLGTSGTGTAFFVGPDLLATVAHVVEESAALTVDVDGRLVAAEVVGLDSREDLALLRLAEPFPGRELSFAAEVPPVGSPHALVGFAGALGESLQVGTISAVVPSYLGVGTKVLTDAVQSDVQSAGGSSGGPWLTPDASSSASTATSGG